MIYKKEDLSQPWGIHGNLWKKFLKGIVDIEALKMWDWTTVGLEWRTWGSVGACQGIFALVHKHMFVQNYEHWSKQLSGGF